MEVYELESCVRGHHVYGHVWRATVDEQFTDAYRSKHGFQNWRFLIWCFLVFLAKFSCYTVFAALMCHPVGYACMAYMYICKLKMHCSFVPEK